MCTITALVPTCWKKKTKASNQKAFVFNASFAVKPVAEKSESSFTVSLDNWKSGLLDVSGFGAVVSPSGR